MCAKQAAIPLPVTIKQLKRTILETIAVSKQMNGNSSHLSHLHLWHRTLFLRHEARSIYPLLAQSMSASHCHYLLKCRSSHLSCQIALSIPGLKHSVMLSGHAWINENIYWLSQFHGILGRSLFVVCSTPAPRRTAQHTIQPVISHNEDSSII